MKNNVYNETDSLDYGIHLDTAPEISSGKNEAKNRKRLDALLEEKRLRQDLDEYDEYLGGSNFYDDILSQYNDHRNDE